MSSETDHHLPPVGTYWTTGALVTENPMVREAYATCARCGAVVNSEDRHDDWHEWIEASANPTPPGEPA